MHNPSAYTLGGLFAFFLSQPVSYFVILSLVSLIIAAIRKNVKKYWFPTLCWLFLFAGLFDIVVGGFTEFVFRPKVDKAIQDFISSGGLDHSDPKEEAIHILRGHWASEDNLTHYYFSAKKLIVVNLGVRKDATYQILEARPTENWVKYRVSGAGYDPHIRTMLFLGDGTAWQVSETSLGTFKSKVEYVGRAESP